MKLAWVALLVTLTGCPDAKPGARGLRVPLPEGWAATPGGSGILHVGPKGRVVLTLERRSLALPTLNALENAVEAEGAAVTHAEATPMRTLVRYAKADAPEGLLAVRTLEPGVVLLCASTVAAEADELDAAQTLCSGVRLEAAP